MTRTITSLAAAQLPGQAVQALEVVEGVQHDVAHAGVERLTQLGLGLGVAVEVDGRRIEAGPESEVKLAPGGHVTPQALLNEHPIDGRAWERLGAKQNRPVAVARGERVRERPSPGPQVVLGHDVGGRAELPNQLDGVAAADLQAPPLIDAGAERIDVRELGGGKAHAGDHAMP